jgi:tripartite-type tricarboxylate transporter receptor subunit TctC
MTLARTMMGRCVRGGIGVIAIVGLAMAAAAQVPSSVPDASATRPLTLIVPFPAGGPSDALARAVAQGMSAHLKQAIVVENISGASGTIGLAKLVKSAPDGSTLAFGTVGTHVANAALYKKLPYDPLADFEAVGLAGMAPTMLVARPSLPASDLPGFLAYADANRAKATYGSAGVGSISHFACVILLSALKQNITHVPYRGVAPAMNDLLGGHIDVMCDQTTTALPQVAGGKIKALAVLTDRRLPQLPDIATAASFGYGDVNIRAWNALFVPKGTPAAVVGRLNDALRAAVADGDLRRQMQAVGVDLPTPADLAPRMVSELIAEGLARDVPALRARGEYLD